jgi:alanine dehydrogenase
MALTSATLPYILKLADLGVDAALRKFPELRLAVNTMGGKLTNQPVSEAVKIPYTPLEKVMSLA